jgi:hypothetical protein
VGHCRVELAELPRFRRQYGLSVYPSSAPYIRILIINDEPSIVDLFIDLLTGDPQGFKLDTATDGDQVVPGVGYAQLASDTQDEKRESPASAPEERWDRPRRYA